MTTKRVNYNAWFLKVITWDGILPVLVILIPFLLKISFPNNREVMDCAIGLLPVIGFFVRLYLGLRHIGSNGCSSAVRVLQFCFFFIGIFFLVLIDTLLLQLHEVKANAVFGGPRGNIELLVIVLIYLVFMIIAMYPGRTIVQDEERFSIE